MYALKGPCTIERPPTDERDRREWDAWIQVSAMNDMTEKRAAEMYISSARTFINWRRAKCRVKKNYTNNRKNNRKN